MRMLIAGCALAVAAGSTPGQTPNATAMPGGTPVGRPLIGPVGTQQPQVGTALPKIGKTAGYYGPDGKFTTEKPVEQNVDPKLVVAPYPGMPGEEKDFWDRLYDRSMRAMGINQPKIVQQNWTPGLARRNRDRREAEKMKLRD